MVRHAALAAAPAASRLTATIGHHYERNSNRCATTNADSDKAKEAEVPLRMRAPSSLSRGNRPARIGWAHRGAHLAPERRERRPRMQGGEHRIAGEPDGVEEWLLRTDALLRRRHRTAVHVAGAALGGVADIVRHLVQTAPSEKECHTRATASPESRPTACCSTRSASRYRKSLNSIPHLQRRPDGSNDRVLHHGQVLHLAIERPTPQGVCISPHVRSLNLSTSVGIAAYEALRQRRAASQQRPS